MSVLKILLQTVKETLVSNPPTGVKAEEISILPEGKVPASMGQRWLTIHPTIKTGLTPRLLVRKRRITFGISVSQRIRDIPNDRFGEIAYMETLDMVTPLEECIPIVESNSMFKTFLTNLEVIPIPPYATDPPYNPLSPPLGLPPRYQLTDTFTFLSLSLDPIHLYPSDFLTRSGNDKEQLYDKIAGYRMTVVFDSPIYQETYSPLQCTSFKL